MHALIAGVVYTCPSHPGAGSDGPLATEKVVRLLCVCVCVCVCVCDRVRGEGEREKRERNREREKKRY